MVRLHRVVVLLALTAGCRSATEITLDVTTDEPCAAISDGGGTLLRVAAPGAADGEGRSATTTTCEGAEIGTLVLVPSDSDTARVSIEITTARGRAPETCGTPGDGGVPDYDRCIVARRVLPFLPHTSLRLPIAMRSECEGVPCSFDETCVRGACVSSTVDPVTCEGQGCDEGTLLGDASVPLIDAAVDATVRPAADAGVDGADADAAGDAAPPDAASVAFCVPGDSSACVTVLDLVAAGDRSCVLLSDGTVRCWGASLHGEIGEIPDSGTVSRPREIAGLRDVVQLAVSPVHTCARLVDGGISCFGSNVSGELGIGATDLDPHPTPVHAMLPTAAEGISVGAVDSCAIYDGGPPTCWGDNGNGQLGAGQTGGNSPTPVSVAWPSALENPTALAMGTDFVCARLVSQRVTCWGNDSAAQLGDSLGASNSPHLGRSVAAAPSRQISAGSQFTCSLSVVGAVTCWGSNIVCQLANPNANIPLQSDIVSEGVQGIAVAASTACAILADGGVSCWGDNGSGSLGLGTSVPVQVCAPLPVLSLPPVDLVALGKRHQCARLKAGTTGGGDVVCWGSNQFGQIGDGTSLDAGLHPTPVAW